MFAIVVVLALSLLLVISCACGLWGAKDGECSSVCVVVAHRAAGDPENSLAAVQRALEIAVDEIEVDVRMTADGELVVCHDETIDRTTNGKGSVADMTLDEIRKYRLVDSNGEVTDELMPTLGDVMWAIQGRCRLLVELKRSGDAEKMAKAVINEVSLYGAFEWVAVQSFDDNVLEHIHRLGHPFRLEKLFYFKIPGLPLAYDGRVVGFSVSKYNYIASFNFNHKCVSKRLVDEIHSRGKQIKVWTVDAPKNECMLPVDGVITDYPERWRK